MECGPLMGPHKLKFLVTKIPDSVGSSPAPPIKWGRVAQLVEAGNIFSLL